MTRKKRFIIVLICALLFLIVTPYIIFYSLGYRIDVKNMKIFTTGGIYVRAFPSGANITIDSNIKNSTGLFSNSVFVQNLSPDQHTVLIQKDGYYDYQKNLKVEEKEVTKLENVTLFKKNYIYNILEKNVNYFSIAPNNVTLLEAKVGSQKIDFNVINLDNSKIQPLSVSINKGVVSDLKWSQNSEKGVIKINNLYFLIDLSDSQNPKISQINYLLQSKEANFNPQDSSQIFYIKSKNLYLSSEQNQPILNNVASYKIVNQNIIWLSYDGFLYSSNILGNNTSKITSKAISVNSLDSYSIIDVTDRILLKDNDSLFLVNNDTKVLEVLDQHAKQVSISPNNQRLLYFSLPAQAGDSEVSYYGQSINLNNERIHEKIGSFSNINDCQWLNDDYIVCSLADKIIISEIDTRGNLNTINLLQTVTLENNNKIDIKNADISFNQRDKKLYILTQSNLISSDRILP